LHCPQFEGGVRIVGIREKANDSNLRHELVQQLESLRYRSWTEYGDTRGIATRPVKARYQGFPHWVAVRGEHGRNSFSRRLSTSGEGWPPIAAMTATCRRTRSAANSGNRSYCPSAHRYSTTKFWPSTNPVP